MTPEEFEEVSDNVAKRLSDDAREADDYFLEHMPGLTRKSGPERLAFYRSQPEEYWQQLTATNPRQAKLRMRDWMALSAREGRLTA